MLDEQEAELRRRRDEVAAPVPEELLARYEALRTRLGGVAVARLVGGRCDGCHLALARGRAGADPAGTARRARRV